MNEPKWSHKVRADALAAVLGHLEAGWWVAPNLVENLAVFDTEGEYAGWIDLNGIPVLNLESE